MNHTYEPGHPVRLPDGSAGVIDYAPAGDRIAPGYHLIDICGPAVYVVWPAKIRGGRAGSWFRPYALRPAHTSRDSR